MKITKLGHSCLCVKTGDLNILFDPGCYSLEATDLKHLDLILITHEHQDHIDLPLIKKILQNNPYAKILTSHSVHDILKKENISSEITKDGDVRNIKGVKIETIGKLHAEIYKTMPVCENVCFLIDDKLFHPGDSLTIPNKQVEILALPTEAPWMKVSEAVEFALKIKPRICFPIHDARMQPDRIGSNHKVPKAELEKAGSQFIILEENKEYDF